MPARTQFHLILTLAALLFPAAGLRAAAPPAKAPAALPPPSPSAVVRRLIDKANQGASRGQLAAGLGTLDRALATARKAGDRVGEARAQGGQVLTLAGLQFLVDASLVRCAREAGVRQRVEFPRLEGSFSPSQPLFVPAKAA